MSSRNLLSRLFSLMVVLISIWNYYCYGVVPLSYFFYNLFKMGSLSPPLWESKAAFILFTSSWSPESMGIDDFLVQCCPPGGSFKTITYRIIYIYSPSQHPKQRLCKSSQMANRLWPDVVKRCIRKYTKHKRSEQYTLIWSHHHV